MSLLLSIHEAGHAVAAHALGFAVREHEGQHQPVRYRPGDIADGDRRRTLPAGQLRQARAGRGPLQRLAHSGPRVSQGWGETRLQDTRVQMSWQRDFRAGFSAGQFDSHSQYFKLHERIVSDRYNQRTCRENSAC